VVDSKRQFKDLILTGVVQHISKYQVAAIIYRVFNTAIRFTNKEDVAMEQEIKFRIKNFDIGNVVPYIEGEILHENGQEPKVGYSFNAII